MNQGLTQLLKQQFGFDNFREGQQQTVSQLLAGHSSLAIFPTGSGKSLCYQFSATQLPHLTLVVSPLLALMKDQLSFLAAKGIAAASIDSTLTPEQNQQVMADVRSGRIKILMISVERFKNERFRQFIGSVPLSMLVVDEAHCISEWGHNFRPDYLKLPAYRNELNIPLVLLLTATATRAVKRDMAAKFAIDESHIVQTGFYRSNLDLTVLPASHGQRDAMLVEQIQQQQGSGIVYVTLQHTAEAVAAKLQQQGIRAAAYHAGFDSDRRQQIQADFMAGQFDVVVATIAFGMGIDKSDIRFVIHYDLPKSIENYSQEIGRAGRDGLPSRCITLANLDGLNTLENFVYGDTPEQSSIQQVLNCITDEMQQERWETQVVALSNASNIRQLALKTLLVQLEMMGVIRPLYSYFAEFKYRLLLDEEEILNRFNGERRDFLQAVFASAEKKKVWASPDFDVLFSRYQCERSRVVAALEYLQEQNCLILESKRMTDVYAVNREALQQAELAQQLSRYFIDKEQKEIKRIGALVRFFELDRCLSHNLSRYFDDQNSPEQCGHCSVCRGRTAKLAYSQQVQLPDNQQLDQWLQGLKSHLASKIDGPLSMEICCRFLAGISIPLFARNKVRQLEGFGACEQARYDDIRERVEGLI